MLETIMTALPSYLLTRAQEEIEAVSLNPITGEDAKTTDDRLILTIQLLNLVRVKLSNPGIQSGSKRTRKRTSKSNSSPPSKSETGS